MNPIDNNSPFNGPLTPHRFRHSNQNTPPPLPKTKASRAVLYAPIAIAGLALLVLPLTIAQINTQQDIRQRASEGQRPPAQSEIVAIIDGLNITASDVDLEYTRQQGANTYISAPTALREDLLNDLVERLIIEKEADARGITVSNAEVEATKKIVVDFNPNLASNTNAVTDIVRRHKLAALLVDSRILNIVFTSSDSAQEESFLELIRDQAVEDGSLVEAATPYVSQSRDVKLLQSIAFPRENYIFTVDNSQAVFSLDEDEISPIISNDGKLFVVEMLSETLGEYRTINDFLVEKKSEVRIL